MNRLFPIIEQTVWVSKKRAPEFFRIKIKVYCITDFALSHISYNHILFETDFSNSIPTWNGSNWEYRDQRPFPYRLLCLKNENIMEGLFLQPEGHLYTYLYRVEGIRNVVTIGIVYVHNRNNQRRI